jgi:hypothetical protein
MTNTATAAPIELLPVTSFAHFSKGEKWDLLAGYEDIAKNCLFLRAPKDLVLVRSHIRDLKAELGA